MSAKQNVSHDAGSWARPMILASNSHPYAYLFLSLSVSFLLSLRDACRRHMLSSSIHHIAKYNTTLRRSPFVSSPYMHSRNYDKAAAFVCPVKFSRLLAFFRTFLDGVPVLKGRAHSVEYALSLPAQA